MKNLLLIFFVVLNLSCFGQGMIGTKDQTNFDFYTNDVRRARWAKEGPLLFGTTTVPANPSLVSLYCHTSALFGYPVFMYQGMEIRSNPYDFDGTEYKAGVFASILLYDHTNKHNSVLGGDTYINAFKTGAGPQYARNIVLNDSGGKVLVGINAGQSPAANSAFQVVGNALTDGFSAAIKTEAPGSGTYVVTSSDHTVLINLANGNVTLPVSGISPGRIFYIKKVNSSAGTITISAAGGTATIDGGASTTISSTNGVIGFQFDGTNYYIISSL